MHIRSKRSLHFARLGAALVAALLLATAFDTVEEQSSGRGPFRPIIVAAFSPVMRLGAAVHREVETAWSAFFSNRALEDENARLREEVVQLSLRRSTEAAFDALGSAMLDMSTNVPQGSIELIPAPVLSAPISAGRRLLWIDRGAIDRLEAGMVVMGPFGVVGVVDSVFKDTALVLLITDEKSAWGAEVDGRSEFGLVRGTGDPTHVEFQFERTSIGCEAGDRIITSGMAGSIAPGGIGFGIVEEIRHNKMGEPVAIVKLREDPSALRLVFVLPVVRIPWEPVDARH